MLLTLSCSKGSMRKWTRLPIILVCKDYRTGLSRGLYSSGVFLCGFQCGVFPLEWKTSTPPTSSLPLLDDRKKPVDVIVLAFDFYSDLAVTLMQCTTTTTTQLTRTSFDTCLRVICNERVVLIRRRYFWWLKMILANMMTGYNNRRSYERIFTTVGADNDVSCSWNMGVRFYDWKLLANLCAYLWREYLVNA